MFCHCFFAILDMIKVNLLRMYQRMLDDKHHEWCFMLVNLIIVNLNVYFNNEQVTEYNATRN